MTELARYPLALAHPFDSRAEGAQVPDEYTFPTQTSVLRTQFTVYSAPNQGNVDFVVQPNLVATLAVSYPYDTDIGGAYLPVTGGNGWFNPGNAATTAGNQYFWENGMISPQQLTAQYARYRVVGWGVRVRSLIPPLNQQGTVALTKVPSLSHWMNLQLNGGLLVNDINPAAAVNPGAVNYATGTLGASGTAGYPAFVVTWPEYLAYYGLPGTDSSGYITQTILSMPLSHQMSIAAMSLDNGVEVEGKLASPDAYKWRDSSNAVGSFLGAGSTLQTNVCNASQLLISTKYATTSGAVNFYDQIVGINDEDFLHQGGWSALCFRATGLTSTTSEAGLAQFTVEIVFHIEGVPQVTGTTLNSGAKYPIYHPRLLEFSQQYAASQPVFKKAHNKHHHGAVVRLGNHLAREFGFRSVGHAMESAAHRLGDMALRGGQKYLGDAIGGIAML